MLHPRMYVKVQRNKKRKAAADRTKTKKKNKTEAFHAFFQAIIPVIQEMIYGWTDASIETGQY